MNEKNIESIFGTNAGVVWKALSKNGPNNIADLVKTTSLSREEVFGALGWLGRENKIVLEKRGRALIFSLSESESRLSATTMSDIVPKDQSPSKSRRTPRRTAKARKVKAPALSLEAVKNALVFIQSEFEANREPTPNQASKTVGMGARQLGKALSKLDIKSKSVRRGSKSVRIYPIASKARVWELAALDGEGLQKMIDASENAVKDEQVHSQEKYTVFD